MDAFYTVSELNQFIKDILTAGLPRAVWVTGELQSFNRNKTKRHIFFEIVEKDEKSQDIVARANLVIFANRRPYIEAILKKSENAFELKDDIEVKFLCKLDFYSPHGAIRLVVEDIDPVYTLGKVAQERQRLIALLTENGVLAKNKQTELSPVPLKLGLITAYDSAAYNDFMDELKASGLGFKVLVYNAVMQGKGCEGEVSCGLKTLDKIPSLDCLIITRGGGSIADLSAFDSQRICETIASCRLPVITGIGHEINTSVTDLAAHTFAKTPTAVAQFLIKRVENYKLALDEKGRRIIELSRALLDERQRYLREWGVRLQTESVNFFKDHTRQLIRCQECVRRVPLQRLQEKARKLAESGRRMSRTVQYEILPVRHTGLEQRVSTLKKILPLRIQQSRTKIQHVEKLVTLASPVNTLKRGFSITRTADGRILRSAAEADKGDIISSQLYDGTAVSQIQSVSKES